MSPLTRRPLRRQSDNELVASLRRGDERAFELLHDRHVAALSAAASRALGPNGGDAEAVVQEAFARAHTHLRESQRTIEVKPWLHRVVRNACIDELRRQSARPQSASVDVEAAATTSESAYDQLSRRYELRRIVEDLSDLPEAQRGALLMRELDGLSHEQIAKTLELSLGAVKNLIWRARQNLIHARDAAAQDCAELRPALDAAHDEARRPSEQAMRHVRRCTDCQAYRRQLKRSREQLRSLTPALGLGPLGALLSSGAITAGTGAAGATAGKLTAAKVTAAAATALLAGGVALETVGVTHVLRGGPGVRAPTRQPGGQAIIGRPIRPGTPLPSKVAITTRTVALPAAQGRRVTKSIRLTCPAGMVVSGLAEPAELGRTAQQAAGTLAQYGYARDALKSGRIRRRRSARIVYAARPGLDRRHVIRIGTLCERR